MVRTFAGDMDFILITLGIFNVTDLERLEVLNVIWISTLGGVVAGI